VPSTSGVLSAVGLVVSERRRDLVESVLLGGEALTRERVAEVVARLAEQGRRELSAPGAELSAGYDLRYAGQAFELSIRAGPEPDLAELRGAFDRAHAERYGYHDPQARLELVTVRVAVALPGSEPAPATSGRADRRGARRARFGAEVVEAAVLGPGSGAVEGPAILELQGATALVPPGWSATGEAEAVILERSS
jgi:N-methylhydantoinase A/oxoprolinase/acetone carboxylase beta subunit